MPGDSIPTLPKGKLPAAHYARVTEAAQLIRNATGDGQFINADIVAGTLKIRWVGPGIPRRVVVVKVTTAISGATGKYNGRILTGDPTPDVTGPLEMPEACTVPGSDDCTVINLSETNGASGPNIPLAGNSPLAASPFHVGLASGVDENGRRVVEIDTGTRPIAVRHGKIKSPGWDTETRPNHIILTPCDEGGNIASGDDVEIWVWIIHPTTATSLGLNFLPLAQVGAVCAYIQEDYYHTDGEGEEAVVRAVGLLLPHSNFEINGEVQDDWVEGDNFVYVLPFDGEAAIVEYAGDPFKCWLTSPIDNANIKGVNLVAGKIIAMVPYRVLAGVPEYHAVNVPTVDGRVAVNADDTVDWLENQIIGLSPHITAATVTGADKTPIVEIQHQNSAITANKLEALTPTFDTKSSVLTITPNVLNQDDKNHILGTGKSDKAFTIEGDHSLIELTSGAKDDPAKITVTHTGKGIEAGPSLIMGTNYDGSGGMEFTPYLVGTDAKGHVTVFEAGTKSTITGDGTHTEIGEPDVGTPNTFPLNHIGPDTPTGDAIPIISITTELITSVQHLKLVYTNAEYDAKGHKADDNETSATLALTSVTVVTDVRVDSNKLQKKTRAIWVIAAGTESGWTDYHTGEECE